MRHVARPLVLGLVLLFLAPWGATAGSADAGATFDASVASLVKEGADEIPVIIRFDSAPTAADRAMLLRAGFAPTMVRYEIVPAIAATGPASAVRSVLLEPRVAHVEHDAVLPYTADRAAVVGRAEPTWTATYQDASGVHTGGITGRGVRVAVVDSGVDATHPDLLWAPIAEPAGLQPTTAHNFKLVGRDSVGLTANAGPEVDGFLQANTLAVDMADTDTTGGHGTHVAGTVAGNGFASDGKYRGAAPGAQLVGYGAGETLVISVGLAAFDHIHTHHEELGIRVVTNSWGGAGDWNPESAVTIAARKLVNEDGLVVLFAAGNDGGDGNSIQTSVWANIPEMISVANYYDRRGWLDDSSSRGLATLERTWPDLAAPGTQIISTAAIGKPVTYVCTGQDAAIDDDQLAIFGGRQEEPTVVSAPTPVVVEAPSEDGGVIVGWYASCTGTSMATPFVAGVVALMLEANPDLTPEEVKEILRGTANMPEDRTYETDGYAVGRGIVDAGEAVAVALRMKDGASLNEALSTAYVDYGVSPAEINLEAANHLVIDTPSAGASVSGATVTVTGRAVPGPSTDNSIPLMPAPGPLPPPVTATMTIFHSIAGAATLNPCAFTLNGCVLGGETVTLHTRGLTPNRQGVTVNADSEVRHFVYRDGALVDAPETNVEPDGEGFQGVAAWTAPTSGPQGAYEFAAEFKVDGEWEEFGRIPFTYVPLPSAPPTSSSVVLAQDFEGGAEGWTVEQNADMGPGLLTSWNFIDENAQLSWAGSHSGSNYYWAGFSPGTPQNSGLYYTDLADVSLVSPEIDLGSAASASLSYWAAGFSELDFDVLSVEVETASGVDVVDTLSGDLLNGGEATGAWQESIVSLDPYIGEVVTLRFRFVSDSFTVGHNLAGWSLDDVVVTAVEGTGTPIVNAVFEASRTFGVESLTTTFLFGASGNVDITGFEIDFGDGSPLYTTAVGGAIEHVYAPGEYVATLHVDGVGATDEVSIAIDVAPTGMVQARIGGGPWVDAGATTPGVETPFSAELDLTGLTGTQTIEVRHYNAAHQRMYAAIEVEA